MKKLTVEQELIKIKYPYPCTVYDKEGNVIRVVTHNIAATDELIKLQPALKQVINTYKDDEIVPAPATVKQLLNNLGQ